MTLKQAESGEEVDEVRFKSKTLHVREGVAIWTKKKMHARSLLRKLGRRAHQELQRLDQGPKPWDGSIERNSRRADGVRRPWSSVAMLYKFWKRLPVDLRIQPSCKTLPYMAT